MDFAAMEATAKRWEKAIKKTLKKQDGVPMKLKKLVSILEEELSEEAEAPTKKSVKAACATIKKVTIEDGMCWYGSKKDASDGESEGDEQKGSKKRKQTAESEEEAEASEEETKKKKKKKEKKKKKAKKESSDSDDSSEEEADEGATGGWNNWGAADLGDDGRKNKFLRLMGGAKASNSEAAAPKKKGGLFGSLRPKTDAITNAAEVTAKLENQYAKAFEMKQFGIKGLGFEAPPKKNQWQGTKQKW